MFLSICEQQLCVLARIVYILIRCVWFLWVNYWQIAAMFAVCTLLQMWLSLDNLTTRHTMNVVTFLHFIYFMLLTKKNEIFYGRYRMVQGTFWHLLNMFRITRS